VLVVSQFTLYGDCRRGRRPDFLGSAPAEEAMRLYDGKTIEEAGLRLWQRGFQWNAVSDALLGAARVEIAERCDLIDPDAWSFLWIVDAPVFEAVVADDGTPGWTAVHHPFTSPNAQWIDRFEESPGEALAHAYDLVCNGNEIGGGSIRIHRADVQSRVFSVLGIDEREARDKFGFLLDAFAYGPPPHGGIAFGWDRIVMLLTGASSLREVIAFPKTGAGHDPLTGAPTAITAEQRKEAGIDARPDAAAAPRPEQGA
jgi:aspartyl-tRNA synthetase